MKQHSIVETNKSRSVANFTDVRQSVSQPIRFNQSNRREGNTQLQQKAIIGNGVVQQKTIIENTGQNCVFGNNGDSSVVVGHTMNAWLDPNDNIRGQSASVNSSQDDLMAWIKGIYPKAKGGLSVKGHLLNDNLGGTALDNNLYPISKGANGMHLSSAENYVKRKIWEAEEPVKYTVNAVGPTDFSGANPGNQEAYFRTTVSPWNDVNNKDDVGGVAYTANIKSDLGAPKERVGLNENDEQVDNISAYGLAPAQKPAGLVGDLSGSEVDLRRKQPGALSFDSKGNYIEGQATKDAHTGDEYTLERALKFLKTDPTSFVSNYISDDAREAMEEAVKGNFDISDKTASAFQAGIFDLFVKGLPKPLADRLNEESQNEEIQSIEQAIALYIEEEFGK